MESLKTLGKCIGRACKLQGSEFHNTYVELKNISKLGANTQTRKNRLAAVGARLNTLARTRALKSNLSKINSLRLAHNVLNAQRSNAVFESSDLLSRYSSLKSRRNKHETDELVEKLLDKEIRPIRKIANSWKTERYLRNLQARTPPQESAELINTRKTLAIIKRKFPTIQDEATLKHFVEVRRLALLSEVTNEDEVARNPKKAAAVERFFTQRISQEIAASNATYGIQMYVMPEPVGAAGTGLAGSAAPTGRSRRNRKTRKAGRR